MARTYVNDVMQSMRFFVSVLADNGLEDPLGIAVDAGFNTVSTPELTIESVEYREGHYIYTRKMPGVPSVNELTFTRGVVLADSAFYDWCRTAIEGQGEYRVDLVIYHFSREALPYGAFPIQEAVAGELNQEQILIATGKAARSYQIKEAFPIRCKIAGDLDATSSEVSMTELDVSYEYFTVNKNVPTA